MTVNERVKEFCNTKKLSQTDLAKTLGLSVNGINKIFTNRTKPSHKFFEAIAMQFKDINLRWLLTGEGQMLRSKEGGVYLPINGQNKVYVVQNVSASGGYLEDYPDNDTVDAVVMNIPGLPSGSVAFEVRGNSMAPEIYDGNVIVGVPINPLDNIKPRMPYIVVTRLDGITVKYVTIDLVRDKAVLTPSSQSTVKPYEIELESIEAIYEVKKVLRDV